MSTPTHDYTRETRAIDTLAEQMRLHCSCGKRSRWTVLYRDVMRAQDRHADEIARRAR